VVHFSLILASDGSFVFSAAPSLKASVPQGNHNRTSGSFFSFHGKGSHFERTLKLSQLLDFYFILFSLRNMMELCVLEEQFLPSLPVCPPESIWVSHSFLQSTSSHFASCPSWKQKLPEVHENEKR